MCRKPVGDGAKRVLVLFMLEFYHITLWSIRLTIILISSMATTLTLVAIQARKVIRYGLVLFVAIIIGRIMLFAAIDAYKRARPKPPPPPTVGFKVLTALPFPDLNVDQSRLSYTLETPTGTLPSFPEQMRVYYMPQKTANLFSEDRMIQRANSLGFSATPRKTQETIFQFTHASVPASLTMDSVFETFSLSYNLNEDSSPLNTRAPDVPTATQNVRQRLSAASSMPQDLSGAVVPEFLRLEQGQLVRALALSDAQFTKINLTRSPIIYGESENAPKYGIVTANPKESNVWFIVSGSKEREKTLIAGEYRYFPVDYTKIETYPIKTAITAFEDLKAGKGYIANLGLNTDGQITITGVELAYFDPNVPYLYFQPVVVFRGRNEFVAYVPAVTQEYYSVGTTPDN